MGLYRTMHGRRSYSDKSYANSGLKLINRDKNKTYCGKPCYRVSYHNGLGSANASMRSENFKTTQIERKNYE